MQPDVFVSVDPTIELRQIAALLPYPATRSSILRGAVLAHGSFAVLRAVLALPDIGFTTPDEVVQAAFLAVAPVAPSF